MKMIKTALATAIVGFTLISQSAYADETLARSSGCLACHGIDKKIIGPGFQEIAAKYKGDAAAADTLAAKIKSGGSGNWGQIPMPPNAHVSDENIAALTTWLLSQ